MRTLLGRLADPNGLRAQPLGFPRVPVAPEKYAVVQPARPSLPELDRVRLHRVAAPERGPRHVAALEAALLLGDRLVELLAARDRAALVRRPGADLAAARALGEVAVADL